MLCLNDSFIYGDKFMIGNIVQKFHPWMLNDIEIFPKNRQFETATNKSDNSIVSSSETFLSYLRMDLRGDQS